MEIAAEEMVVRVRFDRPVGLGESSLMAMLIAEELEFRGLVAGRWSNTGWGVGRARVVKVEQLLPGDLAGVEDAAMLAGRLEEIGCAQLASMARSGMGRGELLIRALAPVEPDTAAVAAIVGDPRSG
ncbi:MAG TPA: hypothetical protein VHA80_07070 [Solirubrobacterales bacterium]|nr:hypothetical protein [Solirubrobacterales bacterium]